MSTRSWDSSTVEGCLAELEYQREAHMRIHDIDCREKRSLQKRAERAEKKLAVAMQYVEHLEAQVRSLGGKP